MLQRIQIERVDNGRVLSGGSFSGRINHTWRQASNRKMSPNKSYYRAVLQLIRTTVLAVDGPPPVGPTQTASDGVEVGLANYPAYTFFDNGDCYINDREVDTINSFRQALSMAASSVYGSPDSQQTNSSHVATFPAQQQVMQKTLPARGLWTIIDGAVTFPVTNGAITDTTSETYIRVLNVAKTAANVTTTVELTMPFPFLIGADDLPGGTKISANLQVNSLWRNALIFSAANQAPNLKIASTPDTVLGIHANMTEFDLFAYTYESLPVTPEMLFTTEYNNHDVVLVNLIATNAFNTAVTVAQNTRKVLIGFYSHEPTNTSVHKSIPRCEASIKLVSIAVTYASQKQPTSDYTFTPQFVAGTNYLNYTNMDGKRAYNDYVRSVKAEMAVPMLSYEEWCYAPIFAFDFLRLENDNSTVINIALRFTNNLIASTNDMVVMAIGRKELSYKYDAASSPMPPSYSLI